MKHKFFCGIDVGKYNLAVALMSSTNTKKTLNIEVSNNKAGFEKLLKFTASHSKDMKNVVFLFEFTGIYAMDLWKFLSDKNLNVWVEDAKKIKRSIRIQAVKSDKVDAIQLALYAYRFEDEFKVVKFPSDKWITLQELHRTRKNLIKQKVNFEKLLKTYKAKDELISELKNNLEHLLSQIKEQIKDIERKEKQLINEIELFKNKYEIITSIPGISHVNAINFLLLFLSYRKFDTPQKLGAYLGVVPAEYSSGSSIRRTSHKYMNANRQLQGDLVQAANIAIRYNEELRKYAERRMSEGKPKRIVIKIVAYKLVKIIWALIRDNRKYKPDYMSNWQNKSA